MNFFIAFLRFLPIFKKKNEFIHTILKSSFMNVDKDELCSSKVSGTQLFKLCLWYVIGLYLVHKFILGKEK